MISFPKLCSTLLFLFPSFSPPSSIFWRNWEDGCNLWQPVLDKKIAFFSPSVLACWHPLLSFLLFSGDSLFFSLITVDYCAILHLLLDDFSQKISRKLIPAALITLSGGQRLNAPLQLVKMRLLLTKLTWKMKRVLTTRLSPAKAESWD